MSVRPSAPPDSFKSCVFRWEVLTFLKIGDTPVEVWRRPFTTPLQNHYFFSKCSDLPSKIHTFDRKSYPSLTKSLLFSKYSHLSSKINTFDRKSYPSLTKSMLFLSSSTKPLAYHQPTQPTNRPTYQPTSQPTYQPTN